MKWWLWLECLVGRHDYIDVWSYPISYLPADGRQDKMCVRCHYLKPVKK